MGNTTSESKLNSTSAQTLRNEERKEGSEERPRKSVRFKAGREEKVRVGDRKGPDDQGRLRLRDC